MDSPLDEHAYTGDYTGDIGERPKPRQLPSDLPTSLDDRRAPPRIGEETEIYDAWQGQSQFLTTPMPAQPISFNLSLDDPSYGDEDIQQLEDSDSRLVQMLAHQARLRNDNPGDEAKVVVDDKLSDDEKKQALQGLLTLAASNGELERVQRLLNGKAKEYIDIDAVDAEGSPPLIYASCFGHEDVVNALIEAGAQVDKQDKNRWTALMWAMTNRHKDIVKSLLNHGASTEIKSSAGRTALDFVEPNSEISDFMHESGYTIGNVGVSDDFYNSGFSQDRFEEEMAENEFKRRMMMESAVNLEVDLGNLGLDEQPESPEDEPDEGQEFIWDRCLNDQMFVFQESELGRILDIIITNMTPQRSPSQKPIPANILFLSARYAHYHSSAELLETLLVSAMDKINEVVQRHAWDMTVLAFWMSNATLLLYYLRKDVGLTQATTEFQLQMIELINEIFILITRDAERRMDKVLDQSMLEHDAIPGFEDVHFQHEWNLFRKSKAKPEEPMEKRFRPPSPKRRAQPSPRNITSLLSSTLFVLDLYDVHSVISAQLLSQLLYWLSAELFNRMMSNRKYLARSKAMQIRMNVSSLEDWARQNNRQPEHFENGSMTSTGETTAEAAKRHLEPAVELLQWLQVFSSLGEDLESLIDTLQKLKKLTPQQLLHAAKYYRPEVGEKGLPKSAKNYILHLQKAAADRRAARAKSPNRPSKAPDSTPSTPIKSNNQPVMSPSPAPSKVEEDEKDEAPNDLLMDPSYSLPFSLPTSTDMLVSYGAGFGGVNKERERKYIPTVPPEFLAKLDLSGHKNGGSLYDGTQWQGDRYS